MNNKLIALVINEMSDNDNKLFMFNELKQSNINFEIYDLSPLVFGDNYNKRYCDYSISNITNLLELLKKEKYFLIYFDKHLKNKLIFDILENNPFNHYYKIANGKILTGINYRNFSVRQFTKVFNKKILMNFIYRKFSKNIKFNLFESGISKDGIEIPSFEYDNYLKLKKDKDELKKNYHVFLDNDMVFHRDITLSSIKTIKNPELYYMNLRLFFDKIEKTTKKEVIIALHPRTSHNKYDFGKRKVVIGNTAELMWDADLTFSHDSTSLHYAIIYNKNLILLTNNELEKSDILCNLEKFEIALGLTRVNFDNFDNFDNIYNYTNREKYAKYMADNIVSNKIDKDKLGSDIIIEYFNKLLK